MKIPPVREIHSLIPAVIFSESPVIYSSTHGACDLLMEGDFLERHPKLLLKFYKSFFALQQGEAAVNHLADLVTDGLKLEHKKMRTKADFIFLAKTKNMMKVVKEAVFSYMKFSAELHYLEKVNPFVKSKDILLSTISKNNQSDDDTKNDEHNTKDFIHILTDENECFFCTEHVLEKAQVSDFNANPEGENFSLHVIFKIDIMKLPGCVMLKPKKLDLLREELQPALKDFQKSFNKLQDDVKELNFVPENVHLLQEKFSSSFSAASETLRKKAEDSIYFNQLTNSEWGEYGGMLSLVIASRRFLVEALYNTSQLSNKVFENLNSYFAGNNLLDKTVLFFVHNVPEYPPQRAAIAHEEIEQLWQKSFDP